MGQLAFLFPGQGSQYPGMGQALYEGSKAAKAILDQAEALMPGLLATCFSGDMDTLTRTENAQPALFIVSLAAAKMAEELGLKADAAAGFSLGEWTASVFSGMLNFQQAFALVQKRGQWMQACADRNPGGMAAVLRVSREELFDLLSHFPDVYPVNFNTQEQTVVAGRHECLDAFLCHLKEQGKRFIKLNVAGAFHSPYMQDASGKLLNALENEQLQAPRLPVYSNKTALPYTQEMAKETLAAQASSTVLWADTIHNMKNDGITTFLELGPGRVLTGFVSKLYPQAKVYQADKPETIVEAVNEIRGQQ